MSTADNERFLKLWYEVLYNKIGFQIKSREEAKNSKKKWFPYNKGGEFRKWYGNNDYVVNWENDGVELKNFAGSVIRNPEYFFQDGMEYSTISSSKISFRKFDFGFILGGGSSAIYKCKNQDYICGLVNSSIINNILLFLSPTLNFSNGIIALIPVIIKNTDEISRIVESNIEISKDDWDSFETSWDFETHPLLRFKENGKIADSFSKWQQYKQEQFDKLKANEEELNRLFIEIYGLQDEMTPEVADQYVSVRKADLGRDIKSFISYAVGCMFGRYSLDVPGLAYAGGDWNASKYKTFAADKENVIPICDDEYFQDDIVGYFVKFVETVYGHQTLEQNLRFISDALGGNGTSRNIIRNYFMNEFYKDHVKVYQKRPIYWLFDAGKKNSFKCLIYMHRYRPDTIARVRTDYVHERQSRYDAKIKELDERINKADTFGKVKLMKQLNKLKEQADEIYAYEAKTHHLADRMIEINLDDGVKHNYEIFKGVLAKIK